ncbi:MAG: hypothetical protein WBI06_00615 [Paludibacter sp.]
MGTPSSRIKLQLPKWNSGFQIGTPFPATGMETGCRNSDSGNFWVLEPTVTTEGSSSDSGN